ncbi:MAG: HAD-IA family hydrolase [Chthoniobacterales bacterium]|nr:HAD-IA family hydrolase [Chthoniobacterales bacterium]
MIKPCVLVFDMDSVLAEVGGSFMASIQATVRHFAGVEVSLAQIAAYKKAGGWNNDWLLSQKLILDLAQREVPLAEVVAVFQRLFFGTDEVEGFILRETWIPKAGLLERLAERYALATFTGRTRDELMPTLQRFAPGISWSVTITEEDVRRPKPAPDGLLAIAAAHPKSELIYVGDNVDDARSARSAGVRFIGVSDGDEELAALLRADLAEAVVANVNQLEKLL